MAVLSFGTGVSDGVLVNEYTPPTPAYNSLTQTSSSLVNSARTVGGNVVGSRVGRRNLSKLEIKWSILSATDWAEICQKTKGSDTNILFYVKYFDMEANAFKIRRMYASDKKATPFRINKKGEVTHWSGCSVNLIDAGYDMSNANA